MPADLQALLVRAPARGGVTVPVICLHIAVGRNYAEFPIMRSCVCLTFPSQAASVSRRGFLGSVGGWAAAAAMGVAAQGRPWVSHGRKSGL